MPYYFTFLLYCVIYISILINSVQNAANDSEVPKSISSTKKTTSVTPSSDGSKSQIPINIGEIIGPNSETKDVATSTEAPVFKVQTGASDLIDVCHMNETMFQKIVSHYEVVCLKKTQSQTTPLEEDKNVTCSASVDLPAKGSAEKEHISSMAIFLILCVLGLCILMIFFLLRTKLHYLPESVACVIIGATIGLILKILHLKNIANWEQEEAFSPTVFFLVILPPIIFESGYNLHKGNFFQNIGSILTFAVLGTLISALVIGSGVYLLGQADVIYRLTFVESFAFGSLISAVDPVATLAIFKALSVDQVLYMLVFGESILNDAISIVLTTSTLELASPAMAELSSGEAIVYVLWRFFLMFFASAFIGVVFGLLSSLTLKYIPLREYTSLELCVVVIFIYAPYTLAEGIHLSGIMAILFNGVVMSHYTHFNLSPIMQITIQHLMRTLALIAECTVFIYLGLGIFSFRHQFHPALVIWCIILCLVGRAVNIFPLSHIVNKFRDHKITNKMMFIMWFSGLRGAIAYALSLHLEFSNEKRHVIVTTTLIIVLFTIFCLGGATLPVIKFMKAEKKSRKRRSNKELTLNKTLELGQAVDSEHMSEFTEEECEFVSTPRPKGFNRFDQLYLRPFLIRKITHQEVRSHASDLKKQCYQSLNVEASESEEELFSTQI